MNIKWPAVAYPRRQENQRLASSQELADLRALSSRACTPSASGAQLSDESIATFHNGTLSEADSRWVETTLEGVRQAGQGAREQGKAKGYSESKIDKSGDDAALNHFVEALTALGPLEATRCSRVIDKMSARMYEEGKESLVREGCDPAAAEARVTQTKKNFSREAYRRFVSEISVDEDATVHHQGASTSANAPQAPDAPKKLTGNRRSGRPKKAGARKSPQAKPRLFTPDELKSYLGIRENFKEATSTPGKEVAALGTVFVGIGSALMLPFTIWSAQDLCRPHSAHHDEQGCRLAQTAVVGACVGVVGGSLAFLALFVFQRQKKNAKAYVEDNA